MGLDILLLPFRAAQASLSAAFRAAIASIQAFQWAFIDLGWLEPAQSAVSDTVGHLALPTLKVVLLLVLATFSFVSSASVYFAFYQFYIPQIHHTYPVYFDFSAPGMTTTITPVALTRNQEFDVAVSMELPESEDNKGAGMFMIDLSLKDETNATISHVRRPCILRYKSTILHWAQTAFYALPYVLGIFEQRQFIDLELLQAAPNPYGNPITQAVLTIDDPAIQLYSASIMFHIQLHGLRYLMWQYFWSTALCCTFFLTGCMMTMFGLAYLTLSGAEPEVQPVVKREPIVKTHVQ